MAGLLDPPTPYTGMMGSADEQIPPLPSWLPPNVQQYMQTAPSTGEGDMPAPGPWPYSYRGLMDEMLARIGRPQNDYMLQQHMRNQRGAQDYPRDEGGVRDYPPAVSPPSTPFTDLMQRLLGNRVQM